MKIEGDQDGCLEIHEERCIDVEKEVSLKIGYL